MWTYIDKHYRTTPEVIAAKLAELQHAPGEYYRDDSVTTLTAIRNSLRRMEAAQSRGAVV